MVCIDSVKVCGSAAVPSELSYFTVTSIFVTPAARFSIASKSKSTLPSSPPLMVPILAVGWSFGIRVLSYPERLTVTLSALSSPSLWKVSLIFTSSLSLTFLG